MTNELIYLSGELYVKCYLTRLLLLFRRYHLCYCRFLAFRLVSRVFLSLFCLLIDLRRPTIEAVVLGSAKVLCLTLSFLETGASFVIVFFLSRLDPQAEA